MSPRELFLYCPRCDCRRCGPALNPFRCQSCGFTYYFNSAASAAAAILLRPNGDAVLVRRAKEPSIGTLSFVGGFAEVGETIEDALVREIWEEVGLEPVSFRYLCSHPNTYVCEGVTYPVLDFYFVVRTGDAPARPQTSEVSGIVEVAPGDVDPEELAFPSLRFALKVFLDRPADAG